MIQFKVSKLGSEEEVEMGKKKHSVESIVSILREVEVLKLNI
jgi:hypothetical protein